MRNLLRKGFAAVLSTIFMVLIFPTTVLADENTHLPFNDAPVAQIGPPGDISVLEPYISVDESGHFILDEEGAVLANIDIAVIHSQKKAFVQLNAMADENKIQIHNDLSIQNNTRSLQRFSYVHRYWCSGGYTSDVSFYWWGMSRTLCDCQTVAMADAYAYAGATAGVAALFPGVHSIPSGAFSIYGSVLANALNSSNRGRGVRMNLTYVLFFSVETL